MAKFCQNCGTELNDAQDICLNCGVQVKKVNAAGKATSNDPNAKSKMGMDY